MARIKEGIDYFTVPVLVVTKDWYKNLKYDFGTAGVGMLIELYLKVHSTGYYLEWGEKPQKNFARDLNVATEEVQRFLDFCFEEDILNQKIFENYGVLTGTEIQTCYVAGTSRRQDITVKAEFWLLPLNKEGSGHVMVVNEDGEVLYRPGKKEKPSQKEATGEEVPNNLDNKPEDFGIYLPEEQEGKEVA